MLTLRTLKELIDTPKRGEKLPTPKQLRTGESPVVAHKITGAGVNEVHIIVRVCGLWYRKQSNGISGKSGTWLWLFFCDRKEEKGR